MCVSSTVQCRGSHASPEWVEAGSCLAAILPGCSREPCSVLSCMQHPSAAWVWGSRVGQTAGRDGEVKLSVLS